MAEVRLEGSGYTGDLSGKERRMEEDEDEDACGGLDGRAAHMRET